MRPNSCDTRADPKPDQLDICGRILVIRAQLHHRETILIGFHGDNSAHTAHLQPQHPAPSHIQSLDTTLETSISHLDKIITDLNSTPDISGILAFCNQEKAYDRVNWDFLIAVLTHMKIFQDFINLVRLLLHDNILHAKVNGHKGAPFKPSNGVKQGWGLSPLL
jgi:hypothetical protein